MRKKLFIVGLSLIGIFSAQAQNLLSNGSFEQQGSSKPTNWHYASAYVSVGNDSAEAKDGSYYLKLKTSSVSLYGGSFVKTSSSAPEIDVDAGSTYVASFWVSEDATVDFDVILTYKQGNEQTKAIETGKKDKGYKEFSAEFAMPNDVNKVTEFRILFKKDQNYRDIKLDNVKLEKKQETVVSIPAPINLKISEKHQREALITWDEVSGVTAYSIQVGTQTPVEVSGTKYLATNLTPNTTYEVKVKSTQNNAEEATVSVTTDSFTEATEANRVPYLSSIKDNGKISRYGIRSALIYDTMENPTITEVSVDSNTVQEPYELTPGHIGVLKIKVSVGNDTWELVYKNLEVEN